MSRCKICRKDSPVLRNGFCSKECVWEYMTYQKPLPMKDEEVYEIDDRLFEKPVPQIERFASNLRKEIPRSEKWFWEKYMSSELYNKDDLANFPLKDTFIPDVQNNKFMYVIEIDGKYHDIPAQRKKDERKDRLYKKWGYRVFRVKAFDNNSFTQFCIDLKKFHRDRLGITQLTPEMILNPKKLTNKKRISNRKNVRKRQLPSYRDVPENVTHGQTHQGRNIKEI